MSSTVDYEREALDAVELSVDGPTEAVDVRDLGPPKPLQNTLERLVELDDDTVLVQINDRAPQHLYPKLDDRGYEYETVEVEDAVVTVVR